MQRYKGTIEYDGSCFSGYQIQPKGRTIQAEIEKVLAKMHKGRHIAITASGRTDAGVHARGQVIHFDSELSLPPERWVKALNGLLPQDISFLNVEAVEPDFHARFDAVGKTYKYYLYNRETRDLFKRHYYAHVSRNLDIGRMRSAARFVEGTHDFTSFCSAKTEMANKVRTISRLDIEERHEEIIFTFTGNGFLYNMVRIIVGTLLEVGAGKRAPEEMKDILAAKDRRLAGKTAPPEGLYLWEVYYGKRPC